MKATHRLVKLEEREDAYHKNNRAVGDTHEGWIEDEPRVGECFFIYKDNIGFEYFRTSLVTEILDECTFKSMNSIYKLEKI